MNTSEKSLSFSIATFNVHMWVDAQFEDNYERVLKLVRSHAPDILCLQEATGEKKKKFSVETGYKHFVSWGGCAIYSNSPIEVIYDKPTEETNVGEIARYPKNARIITAAIKPKGADKPDFPESIYVTCLHLDHAREPRRLREVDIIKRTVDNLVQRRETNGMFHIWVGDFNALTKEDYSEDGWQDIARIRRCNAWESPHVDVTTKVYCSRKQIQTRILIELIVHKCLRKFTLYALFTG